MDEYKKILEVARDEAGLNNFGDESFLEGLEILVKALRNEARLNPAGEKVLRDRILIHLNQRLQIEDWYYRFPEIDDVVIAAPLIGLSLPRTGSTALSFLLAQDPNARSLLRWEAAEPCPPPATVRGPDPRVEKEKVARQSNKGKTHTPSGAMAPAECQDLMALDFKSQLFCAFAQIPSYADWLLEADLTSTYLYERRALKLLQWGCPQRPWRLKCPTHLIFMGYLDKAFPDARFVMTHRDPTDVMLSVSHVYCDIAARFSDHIDPHYMAELNIYQWSEGMKRALAFRDRDDNSDRFYDIHFHTMHKDPIGEVHGLYDWLNEPVNGAFKASMISWWKKNSENFEPKPAHRPADYGIDLGRVRPMFADYTKRMAEWTKQEQ
ncbi:MAG: sulfotransferase family protein [Pseudomonadales bacterium]